MSLRCRARRWMDRGQILVPVIVALLVLSILVPAMIYFIQREAVWTAKETHSTVAFHLAEAGEEKGYLAISLSTSVWAGLQSGVGIPGYLFDQTYSDVAGGTYTIFISSGPSAGQVTIISVGRDARKTERRALKTVYSKSTLTSALYAASISATGNNTDVEWGPITSEGAITVPGNDVLDCYPQIWAVGAITNTGNSHCGSCVASYSGTDMRCTTAGWSNDSTSPCTDSVSWWSNNCAPGVPPPPTIDLAAYKAKAQADRCTEAGTPGGAVPAGSCYWPAATSPDWTGNNYSPTSTHTYYTDSPSGFRIDGNDYCLRGSMIIASPSGSFTFAGNNGTCAYTIPDWLSPSGIPSNAWQQYQLIDTAASGEYYGDAGYRTVNPTFSFGPGGGGMQNRCVYNPLFRGFLYIGGGALNVAGNNVVFHGVVYSPLGVSGMNGNNTMFFYDQDTANNLLGSSAPTRIWWQDVAWPTWPGP